MNEARPTDSGSMDAQKRLERFNAKDIWEALQKSFSAFFFFFKFIKPYTSKVLLGFGSQLLATPLGMIAIFMNAYLIDEVLLNNSLSIDQKIQNLFFVVAFQIAMWGLGQMQGLFFSLIAWYIDNRITIDILRKFYDHEHSLSLSFHRKRSIGEHMYRTTADLGYSGGGIVSLITDEWINLFDIFYKLFWAGLLFALLDKNLGIIAIGYLIPFTIMQQKFNTIGVRLNYQGREIGQEVAAVRRDMVAGLKTFKSLGTSRFAANRYGQMEFYNCRMEMKQNVFRWIFYDIILWFFRVGIYHKGLGIYVMYQAMIGHLTIGEVTVAIWLLHTVSKPFEEIVQVIQNFRNALVPAHRMIETWKIKPTIVDSPLAIRSALLHGRIQFDGVTFGYDPDRLLLKNVSFSIQPHERVALVGPSGCGKSTILNLLLRLYDPLEGRILIDGIDLKNLRRDVYLRKIGAVLQETFLFSGSAADNIRYAKPLAEALEIEAAVQMSDLAESVGSWKDGVNTFLGEGTNISGGQKQRIGIARALLKQPSVWVLDEPTAHLDVVAESHVINTIRKVTENKTTLIVSHRIAPVLFVDKLLVVSKTGIEAMGTHDELLEISPTYQLLWNEQTEQKKGL